MGSINRVLILLSRLKIKTPKKQKNQRTNTDNVCTFGFVDMSTGYNIKTDSVKSVMLSAHLPSVVGDAFYATETIDENV